MAIEGSGHRARTIPSMNREESVEIPGDAAMWIRRDGSLAPATTVHLGGGIGFRPKWADAFGLPHPSITHPR